MSESKIICPSCGAENKYGGKCEFCGATLDSGDSTSVYKTLLGDAQDSKDILFSTEVDKYENTTTVKLTERPGKVDNYHYNLNNWRYKDGYSYSSTMYTKEDANEKRKYLFFSGFYSKQVASGKQKLLVNSMVEAIFVDGVVYKLKEIEISDYEYDLINLEILKALCEGQSMSFKGYGEDLDTDTIRKSARIFYNRVIDSSVYNEEVQEEIKFRKEIEKYNKKAKITLKAEYEERKAMKPQYNTLDDWLAAWIMDNFGLTIAICLLIPFILFLIIG